MKITIKNFGPIDHFEFDLEKDLHVIYGENNIGKSWAIEVLYLLLKNYSIFSEKDSRINVVKSSYINDVKEYIFNIKQVEELNQIVLNEYIKEVSVEYINIFTELLSSSFRNTFSIIVNPKNKQTPQIYINTESFNAIFEVQGKDVKLSNFSFNKNIFFNYDFEGFLDDFAELVEELLQEKKKRKKDSEYIKSLKNDIERGLSFEIMYAGEYVLRNWKSIISHAYFLPSSREGLHHQFSNFGNILSELSRYRFQIKSKFKIPKLSEPIADYLQELSSLNEPIINKKLVHIVNQIEKNIIRAKIKFDVKKSEIKFTDERANITLDILEASSMIAELAPIVLFLKYIINTSKNISTGKADSILFIEEPEAHLHPKVQVEMMKVFVDLAKSGVKVVMTTHSDFMMNELSNLLLDKTISAKNVASYHLKMGEKGSFDAGDMKATSEGIDDYNFTDVAVEQYERRMAILEKLNQDAVAEN